MLKSQEMIFALFISRLNIVIDLQIDFKPDYEPLFGFIGIWNGFNANRIRAHAFNVDSVHSVL